MQLTKPFTIKKIRALAKSRGGKLISKKYIKQLQRLKFICKFGHRFDQNANNLLQPNIWCPECSSGLGERMTRIAFQKIFKKKFIKIRPKWLKNEEGHLLELDGYNEKLKLAFEHRGKQYYIDRPHFHKSWEKNKKDKYLANAKLKQKICRKKGVELVIVRDVLGFIKLDQLKYFIKEKLKKSKNKYIKNCLKKIDTLKINYNTAYKFNHILTLRKLAKSKGGRLISKYFLGWKTNLKFQCKYKHKTFLATPGDVLSSDNWCPNYICINEKRLKNLKINYPKYLHIINKFESAEKAFAAIMKEKDPNYFEDKIQITTKKNQNIYKKKLKSLLKKHSAKLTQKVEILKHKTILKIICKRGHSYNPKFSDLIGQKKVWCRQCWLIENKENAEKKIKKEIKSLIKIYGRVPTIKELEEKNKFELLDLIQRWYGGTRKLAKSLNLKHKSLNTYKDFNSIDKIKTSLIPLLTKKNKIPTTQFLKSKKVSLHRAIKNYGGYAKVAIELDIELERPQLNNKEYLLWLLKRVLKNKKTMPQPNVFRYKIFNEYGSDFRNYIYKLGGFKKVADMLNLKYEDSKRAIANKKRFKK